MDTKDGLTPKITDMCQRLLGAHDYYSDLCDAAILRHDKEGSHDYLCKLTGVLSAMEIVHKVFGNDEHFEDWWKRFEPINPYANGG